MSTSRPAVAGWLSSAPRTGGPFEVVTAVDLACSRCSGGDREPHARKPHRTRPRRKRP